MISLFTKPVVPLGISTVPGDFCLKHKMHWILSFIIISWRKHFCFSCKRCMLWLLPRLLEEQTFWKWISFHAVEKQSRYATAAFIKTCLPTWPSIAVHKPYGVCVCVCSVESDSLWPHEVLPARLLCPWDSPGKHTGVGCHFLLLGIFPPQGLNPRFLHWTWILYLLSHWGFPNHWT